MIKEECLNLNTKFIVVLNIRHRWTGRYEAHLWDNSSRKAGQKKKGRQGLIEIVFWFLKISLTFATLLSSVYLGKTMK